MAYSVPGPGDNLESVVTTPAVAWGGGAECPAVCSAVHSRAGCHRGQACGCLDSWGRAEAGQLPLTIHTRPGEGASRREEAAPSSEEDGPGGRRPVQTQRQQDARGWGRLCCPSGAGISETLNSGAWEWPAVGDVCAGVSG